MSNAWNISPGLNHVGAYQVSGAPYARGSIDATTTTSVAFPYVTKWVTVINHGPGDCKVGFSANGVNGAEGINSYFTVGTPSTSGSSNVIKLDVKVSGVYLLGSTNVDVLAGLTSVLAYRTSGSAGSNWSGSSGVG